MKKILLGTTTLIGVAGLFAGAALADTPKVTIGGYENFELGINHDDMNSSSRDGGDVTDVSQRSQAFRSDTQVDLKIDGTSDAGLGYGGEVDLLADTSSDVQSRGVNASKTFVYMDGMWGRVEMGSNVGADGTMKVDAGTIARATGGIDGDWSYFANAGTQFLAMSELPLAYGNIGSQGIGSGDLVNDLGNHSEENIDKVTYYTPRFAGFQVGVSYLPDQSNRGQGATAPLSPVAQPGPDRSKNNAGLAQNIFTGGVNYDNKFGDVGVTLAATGEWGDSQLSTYNGLHAWNGGAKLSYMGWSLAGSYGSWGSSDTLKTAKSSDTRYWDVGGAYEYGPFGVSLTYLDSKFDCGKVGGGVTLEDCITTGTNDFKNLSLGADYKLAPGLTPYVEVSYINEKPSNTTEASQDAKNNGYIGIIGTQLNF